MSQLEKLRALLATVVPGNRFQTARLAAAGRGCGRAKSRGVLRADAVHDEG